MGIRVLLGRDCQCPACYQRFRAVFEKIEKGQGGKNQFCPHCRTLLWIPVNPQESITFFFKKRRVNGLFRPAGL